MQLLRSCSTTLPTLLQTKLNQNPHTTPLIFFFFVVARLRSPASAKNSIWSSQVLRKGFPPLHWAVGLISGDSALPELLCSCCSPPAAGNNLTSRVYYSGGKNTSHLPGINACLGTKLFSALLSTSPINSCTLRSAAHEWVEGRAEPQRHSLSPAWPEATWMCHPDAKGSGEQPRSRTPCPSSAPGLNRGHHRCRDTQHSGLTSPPAWHSYQPFTRAVGAAQHHCKIRAQL